MASATPVCQFVSYTAASARLDTHSSVSETTRYGDVYALVRVPASQPASFTEWPLHVIMLSATKV